MFSLPCRIMSKKAVEEMDQVLKDREMRYPYIMWDRRMCSWRDPEDFMQAFMLRVLTLNPFADLKELLAVAPLTRAPPSTEGEYCSLIDAFHFKVDEVTLRIDEDGTITVVGKHEEREDEQGFVSREFKRMFVVPEFYEINQMLSKLSFDGVLTFTAPLKKGLGLIKKHSGKRSKKHSKRHSGEAGETSGEHRRRHSRKHSSKHSGEQSEEYSASILEKQDELAWELPEELAWEVPEELARELPEEPRAGPSGESSVEHSGEHPEVLFGESSGEHSRKQPEGPPAKPSKGKRKVKKKGG